MSFAAIPYAEAHKWEPLARSRGVSQVARSQRGFMRAYERAGSFARLPDQWKRRREAFIKRHMAQVRKRGEQLWKPNTSGIPQPSRRALALLMWAYRPPGGRSRRNPPGIIHVDDAWADRWVGRLLPAIDPTDEGTIQARWRHAGYVLTIYRPYEDETLIWTAAKGNKVFGIGTAIQSSDAITTDIAAIVKGHRRKGIYRSVLQKLREIYPELTLFSGFAQTEASANLWKKLGGKDEGDAYSLSNPRTPFHRTRQVLGHNIIQNGRMIVIPALGRSKRFKSFEAAEWVYDAFPGAVARVRREEPLMVATMKTQVLSLVADELFIRAKSSKKRNPTLRPGSGYFRAFGKNQELLKQFRDEILRRTGERLTLEEAEVVLHEMERKRVQQIRGQFRVV